MKIKKFIMVGILALIFSIPTVAFAYTKAFSFTFKTSMKTDLFYLEPRGGFVYVENTATTFGGKPDSKLYYVDIFAEDGWGAAKRENTLTFPRSGTSKQAGLVSSKAYKKYSLTFRKSADGATVDGYGRAYDR